MLDPVSLSDDLRLLFESKPATAQIAADGMAQAYFDFASGGAFGPASPTIPGANKTALASVLFAAISAPAAGLPATIAAAWSAGLTAFWIAIPVGPVPAGVTNGCPGAAGLIASLTVVFANLANTADTAALGIAAALLTATLTVTANVAPPPGTVLPIA